MAGFRVKHAASLDVQADAGYHQPMSSVVCHASNAGEYAGLPHPVGVG